MSETTLYPMTLIFCSYQSADILLLYWLFCQVATEIRIRTLLPKISRIGHLVNLRRICEVLLSNFAGETSLTLFNFNRHWLFYLINCKHVEMTSVVAIGRLYDWRIYLDKNDCSDPV